MLKVLCVLKGEDGLPQQNPNFFEELFVDLIVK